MKKNKVRLGVNVDHVATLRRLRDTPYPSVLQASMDCISAGAEQITIHLREDRRHIQDADVALLKKKLKADINLEMAATEEMLAIALKTKPYSVCVVPEKREERTTEGGLDLFNESRHSILKKIAQETAKRKILCSFFIEPDPEHVRLSQKLGAAAVELHTGTYCIAVQAKDKARAKREWQRIQAAVKEGVKLGMHVHAGHGIDYQTAKSLRRLKDIAEYNIGHFIVCEAVFLGIKGAVKKMKEALK